MKIYLVGGSVRDRLLAAELGMPRAETDRDWVVVGASPDQMIALGYRMVGNDFPVYLHPLSREEYALARGENNSFAPGVSLEQDLHRRDLTINAMAMDGDELIDPYGGLADIRARRLRHLSPAFRDDPLRVLRVARFAASLPGFQVATETAELMAEMTAQGELAGVAPERLWGEIQRALASPAPRRFIEVLREVGALKVLLPEVEALFGVPQRADYHPEVDTGLHTLMTLEQSALLSDDPKVRFAALLHDLGKALTPAHILPRHIGHEAAGVPLVRGICERLRVPNAYRDLALVVAEHHLHCHRLAELKPRTLVKLLRNIGALRISGRVEAFALACEADFRGRGGFADRSYPQGELLLRAREAALSVTGQDLIDLGVEPGPALGEALMREQAKQVAAVIS